MASNPAPKTTLKQDIKTFVKAFAGITSGEASRAANKLKQDRDKRDKRAKQINKKSNPNAYK